jgi:hypothetical protein
VEGFRQDSLWSSSFEMTHQQHQHQYDSSLMLAPKEANTFLGANKVDLVKGSGKHSVTLSK